MELGAIEKIIKKSLVHIGSRWTGHKNYSKYAVVTSPRTGSNYLMSLLSSHDNIHAYGELFNQIKDRSCRELWENTFSKKLKHVKAVGFKIFYDHPLASQDREVWDLLKSDHNIKIIHLVRENPVRSQLSLLIAYKTKIWGLTPTMEDISIEKRKVKIDVEAFIDNIRETKRHQKEAELAFRKHPFYQVTYEKLVEDQATVMNGIFNFMEVPKRRTNSNLRKQNSEKIKDLVQNYEEFKSKLYNTEFSLHLDD